MTGSVFQDTAFIAGLCSALSVTFATLVVINFITETSSRYKERYIRETGVEYEDILLSMPAGRVFDLSLGISALGLFLAVGTVTAFAESPEMPVLIIAGTVGAVICFPIPRAVLKHMKKKRLEKFNLAWMEDPVPWQMTNQYVRLANSTTVPIGTGEDMYLKESFKPLLESGALAVIHPDILTAGGILETKKIGDMAEEYGVQMNLHMAESPVACLAAVHVAAATRNFMALEVHSVDVPWWADLIKPSLKIENGFIEVPDKPGLGFDELNEDLIAEKLHADFPIAWKSTEEWDKEWSNDRQWS